MQVFQMPLVKCIDEEVGREFSWVRSFFPFFKIGPPKAGPEKKLAFVRFELGERRSCQQWLFYQLALCFPKMTSWGPEAPGGLGSYSEQQKAVVQWSGLGLEAATAELTPPHQDFFHPYSCPLSPEGPYMRDSEFILQK